MGDEAVTPVIGTIMILAITVMGIAAVMLWGGPALQRVQEQGAQAAMLGEFQEIRRDTLVLSITDASRLPRVNLEGGSFGLREGTRVQIGVMHDTANPGCDFHVHGWGATLPHLAAMSISGCGSVTLNTAAGDAACSTGRCVHAYRVTGSNLVERQEAVLTSDGAGGYILTLDGSQDLRSGDWLFTIQEGSTLRAQAWLMSTLAVYWELQGASSVALHLEGGALFSSRDGTHFLEAQPPLEEEAAGRPDDFVIEWHTYSGDEQAFTGRSTPNLFLGLVGNNLRVSQDVVHALRFDFEGQYAQAWCNTLMSRNGRLDALNAYTQDAAFPCDGTGLQSVRYERAGSTFQFEFIHARITTAL